MATIEPAIDNPALGVPDDAAAAVTGAVTAHTEWPALLRSLHRDLQPLVQFESLAVAILDRAGDSVRLTFFEKEGQISEPPVSVPVPLDGSYPGLAVRTGEPVYVPRVEPGGPPPSDKLIAHGIVSFCAVPLITARRTLGTLSFGASTEAAYTQQDLQFMSKVARLVALAIENAMQAEALAQQEAVVQHERNQLSLLLDVTNAVVTELDIRALFRAVMPAVRRCCNADTALLTIFDPVTQQLQGYACDLPTGFDPPSLPIELPLDEGPSAEVFTSGQPRIFTVSELAASAHGRRKLQKGLRSVCSVPLLSAQRTLGTLDLGAFAPDAFSPDQFGLLTRVAGQIAIAVGNAHSYRQIEELNAQLAREKLYLEDEIRAEHLFEDIIGRSLALRRVLQAIETVAPTDSTVLVSGETGTGKELVARAIHQLSERRSATFVKLNCAAIPSGLLESELFGHERGAFTGAISQRIGRFELAHHGTVFLDEVGEIPLELQPKLLRVLQEREFERLGSSRTLRTDARLITASNRHLTALVDEQRFRQDLFYRLNVFPIHVPPLRERRDDIPMLVRHFAQQFARRMKKGIELIPSESMEALVGYDWPGNIRELQNLIERAVILSRGATLEVPVAELSVRQSAPRRAQQLETLEEADRRHIVAVLEATNWVVAGPNGAATRLGMKRSTLQFRMQKLGITRPG